MADMSSMADLLAEDLQEDLEEPKNIPPQNVNPQNQLSIEEQNKLPPIGEDIQCITHACIEQLNGLNLPPNNSSSGVYLVCSNILHVQHAAAVEYAKQYENGLVPFDHFMRDILPIIKAEDARLFSNYVNIFDSLEGRNDRVIGGSFYDRVSVLASIITFKARCEHQAAIWETTDKFWYFAQEVYQKYALYEDKISHLNTTDSEKAGFKEWLLLNFPKNIISAWVSSIRAQPQAAV